MVTYGVLVIGVRDRARAERFWCAALGYEVRTLGYSGWARLLTPPGRTALADPEGNRFCVVDLSHEHSSD
jgi:hypothetical protein